MLPLRCRTAKPQFVPVCHQLLPSKPPTPAIGAGGAAAKGAGVTATPTPMLGATPELNTRPGGKPLDPSIRRTIQASESTPNLVSDCRQRLALLLLVAVRVRYFELEGCQHVAAG